VEAQHTEYPVRESRESQRVVVVWVAIEAPPADASRPQPEPAAFLGLARDVAFKREALVLRADAEAVVLAFGALIRTGGDAERALRAALALRDDAGDAAPGLRLGFLVANAPTVVQRDAHGAVRVELPSPVARQLAATARRHLDGPVMVSGNLVDVLADAWRFGDSSFVEAPEEGTGSARMADHELEHVAPLLGPATRDQQRPVGPPGGPALLVGRELELKILRDSFSEAIRARRSRAVLVVGEPGLGKRWAALRLPWLGRALLGYGAGDLRGHYLAYWRDDAVRVNGYDERFEGWGREDDEFAQRLRNAGVRKRRLRFAAVVYHLHHAPRPRPELARNDALLAETARTGRVRCEAGLDRHLRAAPA